MPNWFQRQLRNAYLQKDRYQIRVLNQCWFFYLRRFSQQHFSLSSYHKS